MSWKIFRLMVTWRILLLKQFCDDAVCPRRFTILDFADDLLDFLD